MVAVRRAIDPDAHALAAIHLAALTQAMPSLPRLHTVEEDRNYFTNVVCSQECWAVEVNDAVAGFIALQNSWINHLYVLPKYQGIGVGTKLLEVAKESSTKYLQLWTFQENLRARAFYNKHGFVEVEFTDGEANEERTPDVRLEWNGKPSLIKNP